MRASFAVVLTTAIILCAEVSAAPPVPSAAFQQAFKSQTARVISGKTDPTPFIQAIEPIAASGDPVAKFMLATLIMQSEKSRAIGLLRESARGGCMGAAGVLGVLLMPTNPAEARVSFTRAAYGGDVASQMYMAGLNERGDSQTPRNRSAALAWAKQAKLQSFSSGTANAADEFISKLQATLSAEELAKAKELFDALQATYPRQPFYLCGQSLP